MLNWIKYFPIKLRETRACVVVRGPSLGTANLTTCTIQGCKLQFYAPKHKPGKPGGKSIAFLKHKTAGESLRPFNTDVMANNHWRSHVFLSRRWGFWGPWFTGCKAEIHFSVSIVGRGTEHEYKDISFFHPKAFEKVVLDYLNDSYGHENRPDGDPRYRGPVDWKPLKVGCVFGACFKIQKVDHGAFNGDDEHKVFFPITEKHFIAVNISKSVSGYMDREGIKEINPENIYNLLNIVLNSFQLELSQELQKKWDEIEYTCPDMSLSKTFAPINWVIGGNSVLDQQRRNLLTKASDGI